MKKKHIILTALFLVMLMLAGCGGNGGSGGGNGDVNEEKIVLLPENADLSQAPSVVVEPDAAPYNLGGWLNDSIVSWEVDIPEQADYRFDIEYARPAEYPVAVGYIEIDDGTGNIVPMEFNARPTGEGDDDWSVYQVNDFCSAVINGGKVKISVYAAASDDESMPDHFINLRSITLTKKG